MMESGKQAGYEEDTEVDLEIIKDLM